MINILKCTVFMGWVCWRQVACCWFQMFKLWYEKCDKITIFQTSGSHSLINRLEQVWVQMKPAKSLYSWPIGWLGWKFRSEVMTSSRIPCTSWRKSLSSRWFSVSPGLLTPIARPTIPGFWKPTLRKMVVPHVVLQARGVAVQHKQDQNDRIRLPGWTPKLSSPPGRGFHMKGPKWTDIALQV